MSAVRVGDVVEAVGVGAVAALRARDVPEHRRTRFEVGRAAAGGVMALVSSRRAPSRPDLSDLPGWSVVAMAAGVAATSFGTRRLTQRVEDTVDARLARWHVPAPRFTVAVLVAAGQLWTTVEERRRAGASTSG